MPGLVKGNVFVELEAINFTDYTSFTLSSNDEELTMVKIQNNAGDAQLSCNLNDGEKECGDFMGLGNYTLELHVEYQDKTCVHIFDESFINSACLHENGTFTRTGNFHG